ncbi:MAG TPA: hypothetical protein VH107_08005 [Lacipirellulaceae bacterium]|nr:hypothetical protein [Lacipirellulaceae bacterium]
MKYSLRTLLIVTTLAAILLVTGIYFTRPSKTPPLNVGDYPDGATQFIR